MRGKGILNPARATASAANGAIITAAARPITSAIANFAVNDFGINYFVRIGAPIGSICGSIAISTGHTRAGIRTI